MKRLLLFLAIASMFCLPFAVAEDAAVAEGEDTSGSSASEGTESSSDSGASSSDASAESTSADAGGDSGSSDVTAAEGSGEAAGDAGTSGSDAPVVDEPAAPVEESAPVEGAESTEAPVEGSAEGSQEAELTNGDVEEALAEEVSQEEQQAVATEVQEEAEQVSISLPGGFSRFLVGLGDAFTFDKEVKAQRALERVRENKLRILKRMIDTQTGLARSPKWAPEMQKLQQYIEEDAQKAEQALADAEGSTEEDMAQVSEVNEELNEQAVLDGVIQQEAQETVQASPDLSSEELQQLNTVGAALEETTKKAKALAKSKELKTAGKLLAKGKSLKEVKELKGKAVKHKEARAKAEKAKEVKVEKKTSASGSSKAMDAGKKSETKASGSGAAKSSGGSGRSAAGGGSKSSGSGGGKGKK